MAQVNISEERYQELLMLAHAQGTTPEALIDALIKEQATAITARAIWRENMDARLEAALRDLENQPRHALVAEESFSGLETNPRQARNDGDASK